jgi:hypothetical protein
VRASSVITQTAEERAHRCGSVCYDTCAQWVSHYGQRYVIAKEAIGQYVFDLRISGPDLPLRQTIMANLAVLGNRNLQEGIQL